MRGKFKLDNPDEMQASLTITMSVKQWRDLRDQLDSKWPSVRLAGFIGGLIRQAEAVISDSERDATP